MPFCQFFIIKYVAYGLQLRIKVFILSHRKRNQILWIFQVEKYRDIHLLDYLIPLLMEIHPG
ncbi:MAG: hypothetical protein EA343_20545 [Nodularia sp. (in: Bacteria)]|nr:MAG: hypothetical protein EA343_20545 [Nodularia sp. (in: cyanobacteria)]